MDVKVDGVAKIADLTFAPLGCDLSHQHGVRCDMANEQPKTDEESLATLQGSAIDQLCKIEITIRQGTFRPLNTTVSNSFTNPNVGVAYERQKKYVQYQSLGAELPLD